MKKIALALALMGLVGCATVKVEAPQPVKLASINEHTVPKASKKVFYLLWGLVPITDNSTSDLVAPYTSGEKEIRVKITAKYDFVDWVISFLTLGILSSQTVSVEVAY